MFKKIVSGFLTTLILAQGTTSPILAQEEVMEEMGAIVEQSEENLETATSYIRMHRLLNRNTGEHFYTSDENEYKALVSGGWKDEGIGWYAPLTSNLPVYRLYNPNTTDHHYTMDENERLALIHIGWSDEGIGWYSDDQKGVPVYRQYNKNSKCGSHNYTTKENERKDLTTKYGWQDEGIAWYGVKNNESDVWKNAYKSYIERDYMSYKKASAEMLYYTLFNMNGDDIPELYIEGPSAADGAKILTYYNGELKGIKIGRNGIEYIEGENIVLNTSGNMGNYIDRIYSFQNGKFVLLGEGEWGGGYGSYPSYYQWKGVKMSEAQYKQHLYSIFNKDQATVTSYPVDNSYFYYDPETRPKNIMCKYKEIIKKITNYQ